MYAELAIRLLPSAYANGMISGEKNSRRFILALLTFDIFYTN